jgi:hypothetical protein
LRFEAGVPDARQCGLSSRGQSGCGTQGWRLGAFDHQPQRERDLSEERGLGDGKHPALILWPQHAGKAQGNVGEAAEGEPYPQESRQKTRSIHKRG